MSKQAEAAPGPFGPIYASSFRSWETGLWGATAWRRVMTADGTVLEQRQAAHVKGYRNSAEAERAALAKATGEPA